MFVVFPKNSISLALLAFFFLASSRLQSEALKPASCLVKAIQYFLLNKTCDNCIGFSGDTLVKTATGYEKIQQLNLGSQVITLDQQTACLCEKPVVALSSRLATKVVRLILDDAQNTEIYTGIKQSFYGGNFLTDNFGLRKDAWMTSKALQTLGCLANNKLLSVSCVREISKLTKLYQIEVADTHNFFVTKADALVHNGILAAIPTIAELTASALQAVAVFVGIKRGKDILQDLDKVETEKTKINTSDNNPATYEAKNPQPINSPQVSENNSPDPSNSPGGGPNKPPKKKSSDSKKKTKCTGICKNNACAAGIRKATTESGITKGLGIGLIISQITGYTVKDGIKVLKDWWTDASKGERDTAIVEIQQEMTMWRKKRKKEKQQRILLQQKTTQLNTNAVAIEKRLVAIRRELDDIKRQYYCGHG